jgi:hypothetical protein
MRRCYSMFSAVSLSVAVLILTCHSMYAGGSRCLDCGKLFRTQALKYRIGFETRTSTGGLIVYISIPKDRFTKDSLSALACRLNRDFPSNDVLVMIFDEFVAAKRYVSPWQQEKPRGWKKYDASWRATYIRDVKQNKHTIAWYVDPEKTREEKIDICPMH